MSFKQFVKVNADNDTLEVSFHGNIEITNPLFNDVRVVGIDVDDGHIVILTLDRMHTLYELHDIVSQHLFSNDIEVKLNDVADVQHQEYQDIVNTDKNLWELDYDGASSIFFKRK